MSIASLAQVAGRLLSHIAGQPCETVIHGNHLTVKPLDGSSASTWMLEAGAPLPSLQARHGLGVGQGAAVLADLHLPAALEALFALRPELPAVALGDVLPTSAALVRSGIALPTGTTTPVGSTHPATAAATAPSTISRELFWQWDRLWLADRREPAPIQHVFSKDGRRHPRRPAKPTGTVYRRHIPWLDKTFSLRALDVDRDLATVNRWMNEPAVAHFWQETGDLEHHRRYLSGIAADPHTISLIGSFDDQPFSYFEAYWAKEDRIAPFYDAADHDRGWHVLVGEPALRGREFLTAWMPGISHYLFLDDCRTQRLVIEPRIDNRRMVHSLNRCGYASLKEIQFPHKRAVLGLLMRERFFDDALWIPRGDGPFDLSAVPQS
ncbi:GNAT family N-acetyltransferase [Roseateles chitinivorans]|uniref:GNAT family N-acetyltransferase n=1 Tax=Roseateles chitinivorans TaxID=2917965 RepID=UPI003D673772